MEEQLNWERSGQILCILSRMNLVKRKATMAARKPLPSDFAEIKLAFLKRISDFVHENKIPPELILKWDQTGAKFVPTSEWTLAEEGSQQVYVVGKEDKTRNDCSFDMHNVMLSASATLKTNKCHPTITFPSGWDIFHSERKSLEQ